MEGLLKTGGLLAFGVVALGIFLLGLVMFLKALKRLLGE